MFLIMKRERGEKIQKGEYRTVKHEGVLDGSCDAESCVSSTLSFFCVHEVIFQLLYIIALVNIIAML